MPLLIEKPSENNNAGGLCPVCNRPRKEHTIEEIKICSDKLKGIEESGR